MLAAQLAETQRLLQEQIAMGKARFAALLSRIPAPVQPAATTPHVDIILTEENRARMQAKKERRENLRKQLTHFDGKGNSKEMVSKVDEFLKVHTRYNPATAHGTYFDPALDTYLFTNASGYAYGGWLAQPVKGDFPYPYPLPTTKSGLANLPQLCPVTYYSRKMQPAETRYPVHEQELLGLVKSIRANRHYLIGRPFRAFVDHKSLIYLQEQPHLSRRQAGWVEFLQQFDFSVEYLSGTWNSIADFLSRDPTYTPKCATCQAKIDVVTAIVQPEITVMTHMPTDADWTRALASDDFGQNILLTLDGPQENLSGHARRFRTVDSTLSDSSRLPRQQWPLRRPTDACQTSGVILLATHGA
ncbi:hypothetical protein PhCBS80983_g06513 [Powellomyces hirtus]|uniref:Reverse transcriptase RNase H-like domain-containing protein n=1 Tax=Powellomyces hirtus TaxID=109895 RepID=A0A507DKE9_9FUNG|nr:hypothetical protein PhCBS80983_g06513 [Powellomyces hirtus]